MFQFSRHNWPFIISGCCYPHPCLHYCNQLSCRDPSPCGQLCTHRRFHHRLPPWLRFSVTTTVRMGWTPAPASWCACEIEAHGCPVRFTGDRCSISCDLVSCMHRISIKLHGCSRCWLIYWDDLLLNCCSLTVGLVMLFRGENGNKHCSWCHYLSCVPTSSWRCDEW